MLVPEQRDDRPKQVAMTKALPHPRTIGGAVIAGIVAGILILTCIVGLNEFLRTPGFTIAGLFAFDASTLVGKVAFDGSAYLALGVALHFLVSIGWAVGYAVLAERESQLRTRPVISGFAFGLIVYFAMQLVIVAANLYRIPTPSELGIDLLAHLVFFGLPVAFVVARLYHPK